jgi:hypothetical protein
LNTDAGRIFAVIDHQRVVALCVGHSAAAQQLTKGAA